MDSTVEEFLQLYGKGSADVLQAYIEHIANRKLLEYKGIIHFGGKAGESLWTHVLNLAFVLEAIRPTFSLTDDEMRCLLLALTVHDINKLPEFGKQLNGWDARYANAAKPKNIEQALRELDVQHFFQRWEDFLPDIKFLVDSHQVTSGQSSSVDQRVLEQCRLDPRRLNGPLKHLMKFTDASDNTHSGDYSQHSEIHIREKLKNHINAALSAMAARMRFRLIGHRLAELRGLQSNIIHNEIRNMLIDTYGSQACIDLICRPEGTDYLLDDSVTFSWTTTQLHELAGRVAKKFAQMQENDLHKFVRATPSGISVDDAAIQSGAPIERIFHLIAGIVDKKRYAIEWQNERDDFLHNDLAKARARTTETALLTQIEQELRNNRLISSKDVVLKRGEFLMAYRNFIKEHRADRLKRLKQDAWTRASRVFNLPPQRDALYACIDPYRRGYFMANDIAPTLEPDEMMKMALTDLIALEQEAATVQNSKNKKDSNLLSAVPDEAQDLSIVDIEDYLTRNLEIWDSQGQLFIGSAQFADVLKRYSDGKRQHIQCCYCGSPLRGEAWMSIQVPANVSVQIFSNRLEAGSLSDPKRNVCSVCRTQFILEKLAWRTHGDKRGSEQTTFYLHLFPYSFFPQLLLNAWWQSINSLRDSDHSAFFMRTNQFFDSWHDVYQDFHVPVSRSKLEGVSISAYAEAISNTPVLPLIMGGKNYSEQFIRVLENTVILALWFDCRILLSRLPTPILNLSNEKLGHGEDAEPVALLVESVPTQLNWLLPTNSLSRHDVDQLRHKLAILHQVARKLTSGGDDPVSVIYGLVAAASTDELSLYFEVDRLVEHAVSQRKVANAEHFAINLTHTIAQLLAQLTTTNTMQKTLIGGSK